MAHKGDMVTENEGTAQVGASTGISRGLFALVAVIAAIAIVAAIVVSVLYLGARVPDGSAAKVNDEYLTETEVNDYIGQYRLSHSLTDNTTLAQALSSQGMSVAQFRINAINQLATDKLVASRAAELGVSADESKVDEHIAELKSSLAFNDDEIWQQTLQQYGMTEDEVRERYRASLVQQALCEQEVPRREATDDETLSWAKANLAGSEQHHYAALVFSGENAAKKASKFWSKTSRDLATESFASAESQVKSIVTRAKKAGASTEGGLWSMEVSSSDELAETLGDLALGDMSDAQVDEDAGTATVYVYDHTYTFPDSQDITSLGKKDVPDTLWTAVAAKAADALWSSDCSAYVAKLLADAKVTYYPMPDGASYAVDLSSTGTTSSSADSTEASSSESAAEAGE